MASPFRLFRKNQKLFLALAAGMAMFVFVLADPLTKWLQQQAGVSAGKSGAEIVAKWDNGSLSKQELGDLTGRRYFISNFLRNIQMMGGQRVVAEGGSPNRPNVPDFMLGDNPSRGSVEFDVVNRHILAQLATEAGLSVSDKLVNNYLNEIGFRKVSDADIQQMLKASQGERGTLAAEEQLFSGLKEMLLGEFYFTGYESVMRSVMPTQRWQDWLAINERIALEAAVLPTSQFLEKVAEPSDEEVTSFYEANKERVGDALQVVAGVRLPSPKAGFRVPRRVKLQYLQGDVTAWTEKLLASVSDEEIADYYERNKRSQFVKAEDDSATVEEILEAEEEAVEVEEAVTESEEATPETSEPAESPEAEESPEATAEETEPVAESTEAEAEKPAEESAEPAKEPETPAEESAAPTEEPAAEDGSGLLKSSPFRLVAFQEEGDAQPASDAEQPAEEAATEEEQPSDEPAAESSEESSEAAESTEEPESTTDAEADAEEEVIEYEPLELVSDQIRRQLANDKAVVELQRVMELAYADLQSEYNSYGGKVISAESQGDEPPAVPTKLADLSGMAKQHGLVHEIVPPTSARKLDETYVGKAVDVQTRSQRVTYAAFTSLQLHEPLLAQDLDGQWYLVIKVEDQPSRVPELAEVRAKVVAAWKQSKAAELALETAQQLAKEAQEADGALADFMADKGYEILTTDMFSSRTFGTTSAEMRNGARLGEAPPLVAVGADFMDEAFKLEPEQIVALQNNNRSDAYVVRLDRREKTEEELRKLFLSEATSWFGGGVMGRSRQQRTQQQIREILLERAGFDVEGFGSYLQEIAKR